MFEPKQFIINTIKSMFGHEPEFKVRQYASGWFAKGVIGTAELEIVDNYYTKLAEEQIMTTEEPIIIDKPVSPDVIPEADAIPEDTPLEESAPAESEKTPEEVASPSEEAPKGKPIADKKVKEPTK